MSPEQLQQGFLQLVVEHAGILHKLCRLYGHSAEDRKDLFQEIIIQLWKAFPNYRGDSKWSTWVYRIALNTAISNLRKHQRSPQMANLDAVPVIPAEHYDFDKEEKLQLLYKAIAQLSDIEKAIVILYLDDRSYQEIEEVLGINQGNLRVKMNRIKEKLRKNLIPQHNP